MKSLFIIGCYGVLAFMLMLVFTPVFRNLAIKLNLVDKPNARKVHANAVPLTGGIALAFSVFSVVLVSEYRTLFFQQNFAIIFSGIILLLVGILDDRFDISARYKLIVQLLLAFAVANSGIRVESLYGVFGIGEIPVYWQYILTVIIITGVVNAYNLMDGVDGLIGSYSLLGFLLLLVTGFVLKDLYLIFSGFVFTGALIGFLKFNLGTKKIFMGDAGSLFLGFVLVTQSIRLLNEHAQEIQSGAGVSLPLLLIVFFFIPVFDSLRVYLGRMEQGKSPFKADKSHLHHLLLGSGLSHIKITITVLFIAILFTLTGFGLSKRLEVTQILLLVLMSFWILIKFLRAVNRLVQWKSRLNLLERGKKC